MPEGDPLSLAVDFVSTYTTATLFCYGSTVVVRYFMPPIIDFSGKMKQFRENYLRYIHLLFGITATSVLSYDPTPHGIVNAIGLYLGFETAYYLLMKQFS